MVQKDLRTEIAKEVYLKLVLEEKESRQNEKLIKLAEEAFDVADVFLRVYEKKTLDKPLPSSSWIKTP